MLGNIFSFLGGLPPPATHPDAIGYWEGDWGLVASGGYVDSWASRVGSGVLAQAAPLRPEHDESAFGGIGGVKGNGSAHYLTGANLAELTGAFSLYVAVKKLATGGTWVSGQNSSVQRTPLRVTNTLGSNDRLSLWQTTTETEITDDNDVLDNASKLYEVHRDGSNNITVFMSGTDITRSGGPTWTADFKVSRILANWNNANYSEDTIGALAVYSSLISGDLRTAYRGYFVNKYGL